MNDDNEYNEGASFAFELLILAITVIIILGCAISIAKDIHGGA